MLEGYKYLNCYDKKLRKRIGFIWLIDSYIPLIYLSIILLSIIFEMTFGILLGAFLIILLTIIYIPTKLYFAIKFLRGVE